MLYLYYNNSNNVIIYDSKVNLINIVEKFEYLGSVGREYDRGITED